MYASSDVLLSLETCIGGSTTKHLLQSRIHLHPVVVATDWKGSSVPRTPALLPPQASPCATLCTRQKPTGGKEGIDSARHVTGLPSSTHTEPPKAQSRGDVYFRSPIFGGYSLLAVAELGRFPSKSNLHPPPTRCL